MLHEYIIKKQKEYESRKMNETKIIINNPLPKGFDTSLVSSKIVQSLPDHILSFVDLIYVVDLEEFAERDISAIYLDGAIFVSPNQDSEQDMIDDIIHEYAHSVEESLGTILYADQKIQKEFILKKNILSTYLKTEGYDLPNNFVTSLDYDQDIDDFLYKEIGYNRLSQYINGIFLAPYAVTSVREYWAVAFEHYFLYRLPKEVKAMSPKIYEKLKFIENKGNFLK